MKTALYYFELGTKHLAVREWSKAINAYHNCLELNPHCSVVHCNLAIAYQNNGDIENGILYYNKSLDFNPHNTISLTNLGNVYKEVGNYIKAEDLFKKVIAIDPSYINSYNSLGVLYQEVGKYDMAIEMFETALRLKPNSQIAQNIVFTMDMSGKYDAKDLCVARRKWAAKYADMFY